jgi:hypothetical protein
MFVLFCLNLVRKLSIISLTERVNTTTNFEDDDTGDDEQDLLDMVDETFFESDINEADGKELFKDGAKLGLESFLKNISTF